MTINFPASPTDGQTYTENGVKWKYNSAYTAWLVVDTPILANTSSGQVLYNYNDTIVSSNGISFSTGANTLYVNGMNVSSTLIVDGNVGITGNLNIGVTSSGIKLSVFGSSNSGITTVTDNTSIVLDMTSNNNFAITLGGSNTFINPTTMNPGQSGVIWITQDTNGSRAPSWGSYWKFPSNTAPTLTSAANSVDAVVYIVRNSTSITVQAILNVG